MAGTAEVAGVLLRGSMGVTFFALSRFVPKYNLLLLVKNKRHPSLDSVPLKIAFTQAESGREQGLRLGSFLRR